MRCMQLWQVRAFQMYISSDIGSTRLKIAAYEADQ